MTLEGRLERQSLLKTEKPGVEVVHVHAQLRALRRTVAHDLINVHRKVVEASRASDAT